MFEDCGCSGGEWLCVHEKERESSYCMNNIIYRLWTARVSWLFSFFLFSVSYQSLFFFSFSFCFFFKFSLHFFVNVSFFSLSFLMDSGHQQ